MKPLLLREKRAPAIPAAWLARWQSARSTAQSRWQALSPREQRLIALLGAVALAALVYAVAVRPAWRELSRWQAQLPELRAQAARIDAVVQEAAALKRSQGAHIPPAEMDGELAASLAGAGLGGEHRLARLEDEEAAWEAAFENVSAAALFAWLAHAPAQLRLAVYEADIARPRDSLGKPLQARASGTVKLRAAPAAGGSTP